MTFSVGSAFAVDGGAYLNTDPRFEPQFNATTGVPIGPAATSYTGSATATGTQTISAIKLTRSGGGETLRGVHDHQATWSVTATNNAVLPTTSTALVDYLPAGIEFLGCGGPGADHTVDAPTNPGSPDEYPGSGPIVVPAVPGCVSPDTVDTLIVDPDGAGPLPTALYTRLTWAIGTLAAGGAATRSYRVAIPLRSNTDTWTTIRPTAASGLQAANLDNNSGPEPTDEQDLTAWAQVTGDFNGVLPVSDAATTTAQAEDLLQTKSGSSGSLSQGAITTWTITLRTGEYRYTEGVTVTDTVPNGLCPLGPINVTTGNSPSDSECAPTGAQPSAPYSSVVENANGTFTVTWLPSALPELAHSDVNATWTITMPTRTRAHYQSNFQDAGPILAHDSVSNATSLAGLGLPRCTAPGTPDCSTPGPTIDHDGGAARPVTDAANAGQTAAAPTIDKTVGASGADCATATYVNTVPAYVPGDRICWQLHVGFPGQVDTSSQSVSDFMPPTVDYEPGSDVATGANTVGATLDATGAADGALTWTLTGSLVPTGSQVFEHRFSTIVNPTGQLAPGQLPGNLMKFTSSNTAGTSFPQRDQADFTLAIPVLGLTKGVRRVNGGAPNPPNTDHVTVKAGDIVTYGVDLSNTGTADAANVVVWDQLPSAYDCAMVANHLELRHMRGRRPERPDRMDAPGARTGRDADADLRRDVPAGHRAEPHAREPRRRALVPDALEHRDALHLHARREHRPRESRPRRTCRPPTTPRTCSRAT